MIAGDARRASTPMKACLRKGRGRRVEAAIAELERAVAGEDRDLIDALVRALDDIARSRSRSAAWIAPSPPALEGRNLAAVDAEFGG